MIPSVLSFPRLHNVVQCMYVKLVSAQRSGGCSLKRVGATAKICWKIYLHSLDIFNSTIHIPPWHEETQDNVPQDKVSLTLSHQLCTSHFFLTCKQVYSRQNCKNLQVNAEKRPVLFFKLSSTHIDTRIHRHGHGYRHTHTAPLTASVQNCLLKNSHVWNSAWRQSTTAPPAVQY